MSAQYTQLTNVIATKDQGVKATYPTSNTARLLFPKALGQTNGRDMVICAEMVATTTTAPIRYNVKCWRCFAVDDLTIGTTSSDTFLVSVASDRPPRWKAKHLLRQNSVDDVDAFR